MLHSSNDPPPQLRLQAGLDVGLDAGLGAVLHTGPSQGRGLVLLTAGHDSRRKRRAAVLSRRGTLFVMTGASGVGKDTIRHATLPAIDNLFYSISATTRQQRPGEIHGSQYYFFEREQFERMIRQDELLEYAEYVGDYYGTPAGPVLENLEQGRDVLLELELVGARQVKQRLSEAVMVFIAPPSLVELERRLRGRGTDSEEKIQKRLARAREEIKAVREFDYVVVNDRLEDASATFAAVIRAERARARHLGEDDIAAFLREE